MMTTSSLCEISHQPLLDTTDAMYTYTIANIDSFSSLLGILWELSKDIQFTPSTPFIGCYWDLTNCMVMLLPKKHKKYLEAITSWEVAPCHTLQEVQGLYGKLLHTASVVVFSRAYLTRLETILRLFGDSPFIPHTPPRNTSNDIIWWKHTLTNPPPPRPTPGPCEVLDFGTFSDASSSTGIGIIISGW